MNAKYTKDILTQAKNAYEQQGFIMLDEIFTAHDFNTLLELSSKLSFQKEIRPLHFSNHTAPLTEPILALMQNIQPMLQALGVTKPFIAQQVHWKDYSILSDEDVESGVHAYIELTAIPDDDGGMTFFLDDKTGDQFFVPMIANSLTVVHAKGLRSFMKYANHYTRDAPGRLFLVSK